MSAMPLIATQSVRRNETSQSANSGHWGGVLQRDSQIGIYGIPACRRKVLSLLILAARITLSHFSVSSVIKNDVISPITEPPKGGARWTLRLLENKVVELGI